MDQEKSEAQGLAPLQGRLAEIDALIDGASVAEYLRQSFARGDDQLFEFGPRPDFKDSSMVMAYAFQGDLGLPDRGYYFDKNKADKLAAYERHIAKMLKLSGAPAADAAKQAREVVAFDTRPTTAQPTRDKKTRQRSTATP